LIGGSPLNSEVWVLSRVTKVENRDPPLTRAMYMNYTYKFDWELRNPKAPWSPRCGMGFVSQKYPNTALGSRLVFAGGYGGITDKFNHLFDGVRSRADVWTTEDGRNWTMIASSTEFGELAWMGLSVWEPDSTLVNSPRLWLVGGGYIGDNGNKRVSKMRASVSVYWSQTGEKWTRVNFVSGGGKSPLQRYSSNEWTKVTIDRTLYFLGLWGLTTEVYTVDGVERLYILGGDQDGDGTYSGVVYEGRQGLLCDVEGVTCSGNGLCPKQSWKGCECIGADGKYCDTLIGGNKNSARRSVMEQNVLMIFITFSVLNMLKLYM